MLPQHARHCPVLEAGSALGFLVFPSLEPHESYHIEYKGEGVYLFSYFQTSSPGKWKPIFSISVMLPVGGVGILREELTFIAKGHSASTEDAKNLMRAFIVPEDLGTPAGAVTLKGATNFKTPEGWDTVYTPVFNVIERPLAAALIVHVETN
jgi:hypothetical protein